MSTCTKAKFYVCKRCGNLIGMIHASGAPIVCCGEEMTEMVANTTDAAQEKHVPVIKADGNKVTVDVGSVPHPMLPEHHIAWVYLETEKGGQRVCLPVDGAPQATFAIAEGDQLVAVYEYCNLHGLWTAKA